MSCRSTKDLLYVPVQVFLLGERAIEIIPGITFAMTAGEKGSTIVDGLSVHDGRDGIMKIEIALTRQLPDLLGQDLRGQWTGRSDGRSRTSSRLSVKEA